MTQVVRILINGPSEVLDRKIEDECEARLAAGQTLAGCFVTPSSVALIFQSNPPAVVNGDKP